MAVLLTVAVTWLWAHEGHAPLPTKGAQVDVAKGHVILSREAREALDVQSEEVQDRALPDTVLAYATLVAPWRNHAFASSRLPGRIMKVHVSPGQVVEAGQPLAEVASVELEALQLEIVNAQNDIRLSEKVLQGLKDARAAIPEQSILDVETRLRQEQNTLEIARSKWLSLGLSPDAFDRLLAEGRRVSALSIHCPVRGTVIHADLTVGRVVAADEHLFEVIDLSTIWARIGLLEKDLDRIRVGQEVELRLTAHAGEVFRGKVQVRGLYLDPQTHLNTIWADFTNPIGQELRLLPGMSGQARIYLPRTANARTIPADALIHDGLDRYVFVEEASAAGASEYRKKSVVVSRQSPEWAEVQSPELFPGDRVVTRGSHELGGYFVPGVLRLSPEASQTIGLLTEVAQPHVVEEVVELEGVVDVPPERRTVVSGLLASNLQKIHFERSQNVHAGDLIAEVVSLELQNLQLDLLKEHLSAQLQEEQLRRLRTAAFALPQRRIQELESAVNASRNRRASLRQRLEIAGLSTGQLDELLARKTLIEALPIRAPIAGVVVNFDKVLGQALRAEETLAEIHDLARPWIQAFVSEGELARVRVGQPARVRFLSPSQDVLTGKVVRSGRVFDTEDRTLSVWIELDQLPEQPLLHNQLARVSLTRRQPAPTLAVPRGAVVWEGTQAFVFLRKEDGTFDRRAVMTGRGDDRRVEIVRGLQPGEVVAVQGTAELQTAYASLR